MRIWKNKIIDIYILKEIFIPFLVGVAIITVIGLSNYLFQLSNFLIEHKVPLSIVFRLFIYYLPSIIVQTFPIAILFATMSGMSRLNRENEFTALRLGGVSLYRLIFPLIILGIVISGVTYQMNERLVPWTYHEAQNIVRRFILRETMPEVQDNTFFQGPEGRLFFVSEFDQANNTLGNIVVYNLPEGKDFPEMVTATSGVIEENMWHLEEGIIHQFDGEGEYYNAVIFDNMSYELPEEIDSFFGEQRTTSEMSRERLARDIELFQRSGINVNGLLVEYHLKLAMPLAALIFILIGTPLSLSHKDSRAASIILTILIVFLYYLALSLTQPLGKNGVVEPLISAWLPNIIFGLFGVLLMILKEKWQNWASRFLPFFTAVLILMGLFTGQTIQAAEDESLNVSYADQLTYNQEYDKYELSGEIIAQYSKFHIFADTVTIVMEDGSEEHYENPGEIDIKKSQFTGCDLDEPHYHFNASEVIIYPDDHLIAKHVSFWELSGKLPLMYWPYLYISLKEDDQRLIPEYGYNEERGWFLRSTYYYKYRDLPGELYLDYYTKSGFAGGFKQHFFYENDLEGYLYLFAQENRTNIPGLFLWQGEIDIENSQSRWATDTNIKFDFFETYSDINGKIDIINKEEDWLFDLNSNFQSKDYYDSNKNDDKDLTFELNYENEGLPYDWEYYLELYTDYKYNQEDGLSSRWGGLSHLSRKHNAYLDYRITLERKAPNFRIEDEDDELDSITYFRWPEVEFNYRPSGPINYKAQIGHYYEKNSDADAYRAHGNVYYRKSWDYNNISFSTNHDLIGRLYKELNNDSVELYYTQPRFRGLPYQIAYKNDNTARIKLMPGFFWNNSYSYAEYQGESPFSFDQVRKEETFSSDLNYRRGGWNVRLDSGYDLLEEDYLPLSAFLSWQISSSLKLDMNTRYDINKSKFTRDLIIKSNYKKENLNLNLATRYDINENSFADLVLTNKYKSDQWEVNNGLRYDIKNSEFKEIDNQIIFELEDEWYFELNNSFDNVKERFETANLALKKNFHCRSLTFKYDYVREEYSIEYKINLFPEQSIELGSSAEDQFMFDIGLDELITEE